MKKSVLLLIFTFNIFSLLSCFDHCEDFRYFDYKNIDIEVRNPFVEISDSLSFGLVFKDTYYLSNNYFDFGNNLFAAIDCDKGYGGDKYLISRIRITSDSDFNEELPAGSNLRDIVRGYDSNLKYTVSIEKVSPENVNLGYLWISERPKIDKIHVITIEIEKSNREIMRAFSQQTEWE